jgi:hypothetical protein
MLKYEHLSLTTVAPQTASVARMIGDHHPLLGALS